jgi:hypothetical protein
MIPKKFDQLFDRDRLNPMILGLFNCNVPRDREAPRTALAHGDDPFDLQIGCIEEAGDNFLAPIAWRRVEQIAE